MRSWFSWGSKQEKPLTRSEKLDIINKSRAEDKTQVEINKRKAAREAERLVLVDAEAKKSKESKTVAVPSWDDKVVPALATRDLIDEARGRYSFVAEKDQKSKTAETKQELKTESAPKKPIIDSNILKALDRKHINFQNYQTDEANYHFNGKDIEERKASRETRELRVQDNKRYRDAERKEKFDRINADRAELLKAHRDKKMLVNQSLLAPKPETPAASVTATAEPQPALSPRASK